ncbi:hypothetical protein B0H16DRAFT_1780698 [Mycena metata]|uniref:Uncharacterized protein n=1 Tax=Mycena metata TaxID=1033252 RepID=A0AAD7MNU6_9AGAR|nr:hypothetical protein B0H16DRAFT_1780698 [Mycena metata]
MTIPSQNFAMSWVENLNFTCNGSGFEVSFPFGAHSRMGRKYTDGPGLEPEPDPIRARPSALPDPTQARAFGPDPTRTSLPRTYEPTSHRLSASNRRLARAGLRRITRLCDNVTRYTSLALSPLDQYSTNGATGEGLTFRRDCPTHRLHPVRTPSRRVHRHRADMWPPGVRDIPNTYSVQLATSCFTAGCQPTSQMGPGCSQFGWPPAVLKAAPHLGHHLAEVRCTISPQTTSEHATEILPGNINIFGAYYKLLVHRTVPVATR